MLAILQELVDIVQSKCEFFQDQHTQPSRPNLLPLVALGGYSKFGDFAVLREAVLPATNH
jgi:hypothetical protein